MNWRVTYRDNDAKQKTEIFEADSRHQLFAKLSELKISPIKIEQAENIKPIPKSNIPKIAIITTGLLVCALAFFSFYSGGEKKIEPAKHAQTKQKQVVKPIAVKSKPVEKKVEEAKPIDPNARPTKIGEVLNGYVMLPSGRIHRQLGVVTNSIAGRPKGKYSIFRRSCDNEIACYLTLKPGAMIFGSLQHNGRFKRDFIESLNEKIEITPEDSEEQAQLKRDVIDARKFLKEALDRGDDIEKLMQETRAELQDLMKIRVKYQSLFTEHLKDCKTDADIEDLFNACNKMLEEKGIAPLSYGTITKKNLLRQKANKEF